MFVGAAATKRNCRGCGSEVANASSSTVCGLLACKRPLVSGRQQEPQRFKTHTQSPDTLAMTMCLSAAALRVPLAATGHQPSRHAPWGALALL